MLKIETEMELIAVTIALQKWAMCDRDAFYILFPRTHRRLAEQAYPDQLTKPAQLTPTPEAEPCAAGSEMATQEALETPAPEAEPCAAGTEMTTREVAEALLGVATHTLRLFEILLNTYYDLRAEMAQTFREFAEYVDNISKKWTGESIFEETEAATE